MVISSKKDCYLLNDEFIDEGKINLNLNDKENSCYEETYSKKISTKSNSKYSNNNNIDFIIVENEDNIKKLVVNLELKLKNKIKGFNNIKVDFEINEDIYMNLIKELLK
jgi:hypothetical protein